MRDHRLCVYVAGPYAASHPREIQRNVDIAVDAGIKIWKKGHYPYIPQLAHYVDLRPSCDLKREDYLEWDDVWLRFCDALLYVAPSDGADKELSVAKSIGMRIFYSIDEIPTIPRIPNARLGGESSGTG